MQEVPLFSAPVPVAVAEAGNTVSAANVNLNKSSMGLVGRGNGSFYAETGTLLHQEMMGGGGGGGGGGVRGGAAMEEMDYHQYGFRQNSFGSGGTRRELYTSYHRLDQDLFEGIALPNHLLNDYYSQVKTNETEYFVHAWINQMCFCVIIL